MVAARPYRDRALRSVTVVFGLLLLALLQIAELAALVSLMEYTHERGGRTVVVAQMVLHFGTAFGFAAIAVWLLKQASDGETARAATLSGSGGMAFLAVATLSAVGGCASFLGVRSTSALPELGWRWSASSFAGVQVPSVGIATAHCYFTFSVALLAGGYLLLGLWLWYSRVTDALLARALYRRDGRVE